MTGAPACNTWLYAVVDDVDPALLAQVTGVADEPLRCLTGARATGTGVTDAGLAAVVGSVPRSDFDEPVLQAHLEDLRWLESAVRAHHRVIDTLARAGCRTLPLRFATIFGEDRRVDCLLTEQREEFVATLDRVAHHMEWGVKAYAGATATATAAEQAGAPAASAPSAATQTRPGTAYLLRRRTAREQHDRANDEARHSAARVHAALAEQASEATEHQLQGSDATGTNDPMVLNGTYLVDRARADAFAAATAVLADRNPDLRLELTGPWPPYSFVDIAPGQALQNQPRPDQSRE